MNQTEKLGFYCRVDWSEYPAIHCDEWCKEQCTDCQEQERDWMDAERDAARDSSTVTKEK